MMRRQLCVAMAASLLVASFAPPPAFAQDQSASSADTAINNCFGGSSDTDKAVLGKSCLLAFDGAIKQAQRSDVHSPQRLNLYWAQASQVSGILVYLFVEQEQGFKRNACTTAYRGWQSWNQIDAEFKEASGITISPALEASTRHCEEHWDRGEWQ